MPSACRSFPFFPVLLERDAKPEALPPLLALFQSTPWSPTEPLPNTLIDAIRSVADGLLEQIGRTVHKGKLAALELLLRLTRVHDEGRHTRQRISRDEAVAVAGDGRDDVGERVVQLLSGERQADVPGGSHSGALRLITTSTEKTSGNEKVTQYVDLIHETLIRTHGKDEKTGKRLGYWPTLYEYIENNRDCDIHRQRLKFQAERWVKGRGLGRWRNLAGWRDLRLYQRLRIRKDGQEGHFLFWSRWTGRAQMALPVAILGLFGESTWWVNQNNFPIAYTLIKPLWALRLNTPLPEMVGIPKGEFTMGCLEGRDDVESECTDDEKPPHKVTIARPFTMGKHEVTFLQYDYYVWSEKRKEDTPVDYPSDQGWGRFDRPVINVSWDDAKAYARWLSDKTGKPCRLPTEAEWEYAARAGTETAYWWGKKLEGSDANCDVSASQWGVRMTAPVGTYPVSPWKMYDTAGNVWEWVEDEYRVYATTPGPQEQPAGDVSRVLRGGSWGGDPGGCRAADRGGGPPGYRSGGVGFRVCCSAPIE